jgi:protoporphyrinogen oxidase
MEKHMRSRPQPNAMIGVVGGGIAGLVAAYRLTERGREVRVFETSDDLGGLTAPVETGGDPAERYPTVFAPDDDDAIADLTGELGLADRLAAGRIVRGQYVDGRAHHTTRAAEALAYPQLSLQDKLFYALFARGTGAGPLGPPEDAFETPAAYDDVTALTFAADHATAAVAEYAVEPRLRAEFGDRADDVSAAWLLGEFARLQAGRSWRGDRVRYLDGGVATLIDALVERIGRENVETGARVVDLETTSTGDGTGETTLSSEAAGDDEFVWGDDTEADGGRDAALGTDPNHPDGDTATQTEGERIDHLIVEREGERTAVDVDAAVFATPPQALERATSYEWHGESRGVVCALVGLSESLLDADELTVADDAPFGRLVERTNLVDPKRYGGDHLLYLVAPVTDLRDERWQLDDDALVTRWLDALQELFPQFDRDTVRWSNVSRARHAGPVYETGYREQRIPHDLSDAVAEHCFYAGGASEAQYPTWTLAGAVRAGRECSDLVGGPDDTE